MSAPSTITRAASMPSSLSTFIEAATASVARAIASIQREAERERQLREAQFAAGLAELNLRMASVADLERRLTERLATLKDGAPGRDGIDGRDGADGVNGQNGGPGRDGIHGDRGEAGEPGHAGGPGRDGTDGKDGGPGRDGQDAAPVDVEALRASIIDSIVASIPVPKDGAPGRDGADGQAGTPGRDGVDGKDGAPGQDGTNGQDGAPGRDGVDGKDGAPGRDGDKGERGDNGDKGDPGLAGADGAPGRDGANGERGVEGPAGKLPVVKEWVDAVHYEGNVVTHSGSCYQALRDTAKEPPHADWRCIAAAGREGVDGRSFVIRGTWSETEKYGGLDIVALNGASFVARRDNPGPCPGEGWQLMASQGKQGKPGIQGPLGRGERGFAGPPVVSMEIDDNATLKLTNADGSVATCDLYPLLSKIG